MQNPHAKSKEEIFGELQTSERGLTKYEAEKRLKKFGENKLTKQKKPSIILKFLKQFKSALIYILLVAMIISFIFDHLVDAYVILIVILINATIGFIQERKAERAIEALSKLVVSYAKAYRDNQILKIPSTKVVPGDIIILEEGDKVPADARLLEIKDFRTQESSLTGESLPQEKRLGILDKSVSLGDRTNSIFMGTLVVSGQAKAIVIETGNKTAVGQIAESIQAIIQPKMHLNEKINQLAFQMGTFAIAGALLIFIVGYFIRGLEFFEIFLFTIASLVSGIPEGLPAVLIIILAIGSVKMAKRNAIIKHLPAIETVGVATIIATDKTGTLTQNSLTVEKIITANYEVDISGNGWIPEGDFSINNKKINPSLYPEIKKSLIISALCNKGNLVKTNGSYEVVGDPTEVALVALGKKAKFEKGKLCEKVIDDLPFSSDAKFRASLVDCSGNKNLFSVGAFEKILEISSSYLINNTRKKLDKKTKEKFLKKAEELAKQGMRILALGYKEVNSKKNSISKEDVNNLIFVGLVAMKDPPRKDVKDSIDKARKAGIRVLMKTGDHKETALAIAKEIGLVGENAKALTEEELENLSQKDFDKAVKEISIFARVTPKMKLKIVESLQIQGEIVAMTGDGVNDAPALKRADIGIAMGIIGTDVARESSELILADDNFSSIVNAIEEGRIIFQNIRQTSFFLVTTNVAEHVTILSSMAIGLPLPMLPIQILYLNLVTDTFSGIALAMEPGHNDVLNIPPRNKKEKILNKSVIPFLVLIVGLMVVGTLPLFKYFISDIDKARTIAFTSMTMFQLFNVLNMRSLDKSIFRIGFLSNKWVLIGLSASILGMLGVIYLPWISDVFQFVSLSFYEIFLITLVTSSVFVFGEIYKFFHNKRMI